MVNWKGIAIYVLQVLVWILWGLGASGVVPQLKEWLPVWVPIAMHLFAWLGVSSPAMPPMLAMFRRRGPPPGAAGVFLLVVVASQPLGVLVAAASVVSCTPAQDATWVTLEKTVLADVIAGKTRQQIEQDVGMILGGQTGETIATIVDDVLTFLLDIGAIPTPNIQSARTMLALHKKVSP